MLAWILPGARHLSRAGIRNRSDDFRQTFAQSAADVWHIEINPSPAPRACRCYPDHGRLNRQDTALAARTHQGTATGILDHNSGPERPRSEMAQKGGGRNQVFAQADSPKPVGRRVFESASWATASPWLLRPLGSPPKPSAVLPPPDHDVAWCSPRALFTAHPETWRWLLRPRDPGDIRWRSALDRTMASSASRRDYIIR
jgi:hypothetical protein